MRKEFWLHPSVIGLLVLSLALIAMTLAVQAPPAQLLWFLLPVILAPFYEWAMHKWVLHAALPRHKGMQHDMAMRLHHQHHMTPTEVSQIFAPVWAIAFVIVKFALIFWFFMGWKNAIVPVLSVVLYYLFYEWMHYSHHDNNYQPRTKYGGILKKAHMHHHFYNHNLWWGVTYDLADRLFNTGGRFSIDIPRSADPRHINTSSVVEVGIK